MEERACRMAAGESGFSAQVNAAKAMYAKMQAELAKEKAILAKKYGVGLAGQAAMMAALARFRAQTEAQSKRTRQASLLEAAQ